MLTEQSATDYVNSLLNTVLPKLLVLPLLEPAV